MSEVSDIVDTLFLENNVSLEALAFLQRPEIVGLLKDPANYSEELEYNGNNNWIFQAKKYFEFVAKVYEDSTKKGMSEEGVVQGVQYAFSQLENPKIPDHLNVILGRYFKEYASNGQK